MKKRVSRLWPKRTLLCLILALAILCSGCSGLGAPNFRPEMTQTLSNGDTFYTPSSDHVVSDIGRSLLYYNNLLLVFTDYDLNDVEMDLLAQLVDGEPVGAVRGGIHALQILVEDSSLAALERKAALLMEQPAVMYASSEYPVQIMDVQSDQNPWSEFSDYPSDDVGNESNPDGNDWWAEAIGAYTAWEYADQCSPIKVGIADSGFATEHEDLKGQITLVCDSADDATAEHGTHVAGIIGALDNDVGIRGIADTAQLYCADLWLEDHANSFHTMAEYLAVINYMAQNGVRVVNNSWGCIVPSESTYLMGLHGLFYFLEPDQYENNYQQWMERRLNQDLVTTAEASIVMISQLIESGYEDMIIVQAAGNGYDNGWSGADAKYNGFFSSVTEEVYSNMAPSLLEKLSARGITYQSIDERILIVGAVENWRDSNGNYYLTYFSNFGDAVDICAPGDYIFSTVTPSLGSYSSLSGTSMAAPMVTGSVAYVWSLNPGLSVAEVRSIILESYVVRAVGVEDGSGYTYPMLNVGMAAQEALGRIEAVELSG